MQFLRRIIYLVHYLCETDYKRLKPFLKFASLTTGKPTISMLIDSVRSVFKYNTSLLDYFYFRFYLDVTDNKSDWAGTGFMYEYQLKMNPTIFRKVLENKSEFNKKFRAMIGRESYTINELEKNPELTKKLYKTSCKRVVLKKSTGQAGREVQILDTKYLINKMLIRLMKSHKYDLAEEYVIQHPEMMKLSPSGLNTVRIITQELNGSIFFIAARLRISINSPVDNLAAGNAAAPIDLETGIVTGPAVFSDILKEDIKRHPITGANILGFRLPFWTEVKELVRKAALMIPENRSIGWDIAITINGPVLIEGNHNWCKLLWQLPVKKGLKKELEKFL